MANVTYPADQTKVLRYQEVFRQAYPRLLAYARGFVGSDNADDVVQDVFAELWERRMDVEMGEQLLAFLFRSVYTHSINVLKHRQVSERYIDAVKAIQEHREAYAHQTPLTLAVNADLRQAIDEAIAQLPNRCREIFTKSYVEGKRNKDIAAELQLSVKTVDAQIYKALKMLRAHLKDVGHWTLILLLVLLTK